MRLFIKNLLLFFLLFLFLFPLYSYIWEFKISKIFPSVSIGRYIDDSSDYMKLRTQEVQKTQNVDILFLGSSHTYRGFDPRIFKTYGMDSFNLGSSSQSPLQTEVLLKRYYRDLNPKMVIFEIYPGVFEGDGVEASLVLLSSDKIDFPAFWMTLITNNRIAYSSLLKAFFNNNLAQTKTILSPTKYRTHNYVSGGYVERDQLYFYKPEPIDRSTWTYNKSQWKAFERCLKIIKSNDAQVVLVYAPITKALYDSKTNNEEFLERMRVYGYPVYDFNTKINLDDTLHFYDSHHLNQDGVKLFNRAILAELNP